MSLLPYMRLDRVKPLPFVFDPDAKPHWRWSNKLFWSWIDERIEWLDEQAEKDRQRKAEAALG